MFANQPALIGITRCSRLDDYIAAVEQTGARVRILDPGHSPQEALGEIDGLLLTGGADVDPALYGEPRHPTTQNAEPGRDALEVELARGAMKDDMPLLAICRGAQVLNVAAGGALLQDIPSMLPSGVPHDIRAPKDFACHAIALEADARLARVLGGIVRADCSCRVNSRHHQAVGRIGEGLVVSARAADGIVEGIEKPEARFCIGVQWHPENFWLTGEFSPLFDAFVRAAASRH